MAFPATNPQPIHLGGVGSFQALQGQTGQHSIGQNASQVHQSTQRSAWGVGFLHGTLW